MAVDDTEFSEFFASHYAGLCWLGYLLTGSRAEAEDLAQEALVRTWWRWKLVRRPDDPGSYARQVLVNRRRSLLRRARPHPHPRRGTARPRMRECSAISRSLTWTRPCDTPRLSARASARARRRRARSR